MKRVPAFSIGPRGWKDEAKPSVRRVDSKCVPSRKKFVTLGDVGTGDPTQRMVVLELLVNSPRCAKATITGLLIRAIVLRLLSARVAITACPGLMPVTAPRRL